MVVFASVAMIVMTISQIGSYLVSTYLSIGETVVVNPLIFLTHTRNMGGIFGSFQGKGLIFTAFSSCFLIGLIIYLLRSTSGRFYEYVFFGCIVGGGVSNVMDRLLYGGVIDFINIQNIPYWKYIFNTADVMIHVGLWPMIIFHLFLNKRRTNLSENV